MDGGRQKVGYRPLFPIPVLKLQAPSTGIIVSSVHKQVIPIVYFNLAA